MTFFRQIWLMTRLYARCCCKMWKICIRVHIMISFKHLLPSLFRDYRIKPVLCTSLHFYASFLWCTLNLSVALFFRFNFISLFFRSAILQCFFRFTWCTSHSRPFKIFPIALFHNDCTFSTLLWLSLRFSVLMMFSFDTPKLNEKRNQKAQRNFINTFQCYERYQRERERKKKSQDILPCQFLQDIEYIWNKIGPHSPRHWETQSIHIHATEEIKSNTEKQEIIILRMQRKWSKKNINRNHFLRSFRPICTEEKKERNSHFLPKTLGVCART